MNTKVKWTRFPKMNVWNNQIWVDMPFKSVSTLMLIGNTNNLRRIYGLVWVMLFPMTKNISKVFYINENIKYIHTQIHNQSRKRKTLNFNQFESA